MISENGLAKSTLKIILNKFTANAIMLGQAKLSLPLNACCSTSNFSVLLYKKEFGEQQLMIGCLQKF